MGSEEERKKFVGQVRKACRIARRLRELGARPHGVVRIDSACGVADWTKDSEANQQRIAQTFSAACDVAEEFGERLAAEGGLGDAVHVVDETTGRVVSGGHAALAILDALPGGWLLRPWAGLPPTAAAADVVYRVAVRHRDRLAWLMGMRDDVSCPIRPAAHPGTLPDALPTAEDRAARQT